MTDQPAVKHVTLDVPAIACHRGPADGWVGTGWEITVNGVPLGRAWNLGKAREQAAQALLAALDARTEVLRWLVSLDDPEDVTGREQRRTVTLDQVIACARAALDPSGDQPPADPAGDPT